jgi:hypothetical protein
LVVEMFKYVCELIVINKDYLGAYEYLQKSYNLLVSPSVAVTKLITTKSISKQPSEYKQAPAHVRMIQRKQAEDPSFKVYTGMRIEYIHVLEGNTNTQSVIEEPVVAMKKNMRINIDYYIDNVFSTPVTDLWDGLKPLLPVGTPKPLFLLHQSKKIIKKRKIVENNYNITSFFSVSKTCALCKQLVKSSKDNICSDCRTDGSLVTIHRQLKHDKEEYDVLVSATMDVCVSCKKKNPDVNIDLCSNSSCENLYRRIKLDNKKIVLDKLEGLDW